MRLRLLIFVLFLAGTVWAQTATDITGDPHYSLLFQNDNVRAYSLVLPPQQQTFVRYQHNFLLVSLQDSNLILWVEGHSDLPSYHLAAGGASFFYSVAPKAQGFRNAAGTTYSGTTYRGVLVEFLDPKVTTYGYQTDGQWEFGYGSITPSADPQPGPFNRLILNTAIIKDFQLPPGAAAPPPDTHDGELLISVSDLNLQNADSHIQKSAGEVAWIPEGRKSALTNAGNQPARFVLIELGPPPIAAPKKQ